MKRRDFLKNAGAAIVPAALPAALWGSSPSAATGEATRPADRLVVREQAPIAAVLYDERYADCRAFAAALERRGVKAFATNQDAVALWYGPLRVHLESSPGRVAGLATYADFLSSIACGRELAYAIRFEGHHDARSGGMLTHHLVTWPDASGNSVGIADPRDISMSLAAGDWATQLAEALWRIPEPAPASRMPESSKVAAHAARRAQSQSVLSSDRTSYLTSWLISP